MDRSKDGQITIEDLKGVFNVKNHPKYLSGELTEEQLMKQYLDSFDTKNHGDGIINYDEFVHCEFFSLFCFGVINYCLIKFLNFFSQKDYAAVSSNIDSDPYFDAMMRQSWKL
jgi:hypothetical protein